MSETNVTQEKSSVVQQNVDDKVQEEEADSVKLGESLDQSKPKAKGEEDEERGKTEESLQVLDKEGATGRDREEPSKSSSTTEEGKVLGNENVTGELTPLILGQPQGSLDSASPSTSASGSGSGSGSAPGSGGGSGGSAKNNSSGQVVGRISRDASQDNEEDEDEDDDEDEEDEDENDDEEDAETSEEGGEECLFDSGTESGEDLASHPTTNNNNVSEPTPNPTPNPNPIAHPNPTNPTNPTSSEFPSVMESTQNSLRNSHDGDGNGDGGGDGGSDKKLTSVVGIGVETSGSGTTSSGSSVSVSENSKSNSESESSSEPASEPASVPSPSPKPDEAENELYTSASSLVGDAQSQIKTTGSVSGSGSGSDLIQQVDSVLTLLRDSLVGDPDRRLLERLTLDKSKSKSGEVEGNNKEVIALIDRLKTSLGGNSNSNSSSSINSASASVQNLPVVKAAAAVKEISPDLNSSNNRKSSLPSEVLEGPEMDPNRKILNWQQPQQPQPPDPIQIQTEKKGGPVWSSIFPKKTSPTSSKTTEDKTTGIHHSESCGAGTGTGTGPATGTSQEDGNPWKIRARQKRNKARSHTVGVSEEELAEARQYFQEETYKTALNERKKERALQKELSEQQETPGPELTIQPVPVPVPVPIPSSTQSAFPEINPPNIDNFNKNPTNTLLPFNRGDKVSTTGSLQDFKADPSLQLGQYFSKDDSSADAEAAGAGVVTAGLKLKPFRTLSLDSNYDPSKTLFTPGESAQIAIHKAAIKKQLTEEEERRRRRRNELSANKYNNEFSVQMAPVGKGYAAPPPFPRPPLPSVSSTVDSASSIGSSDYQQQPGNSSSVASILSTKTTPQEESLLELELETNANENNSKLISNSQPTQSRPSAPNNVVNYNNSNNNNNAKLKEMPSNKQIENVQILLQDLNPSTSAEFPKLQIAITVNTGNQVQNQRQPEPIQHQFQQPANNIQKNQNINTTSNKISGNNENGETELEIAYNNNNNNKNSYIDNIRPSIGEHPTKGSRYRNKKDRQNKLKRSNTIDIPQPPDYDDQDSELDDDLLEDDLFASSKAIPPFQPKTEGDRKFLAFLEKNNAFEGNKPLRPTYLGVNDKQWNNRFFNLKTSFESSSQGSSPSLSPVPTYKPRTIVTDLAQAQNVLVLKSNQNAVDTLSKPIWATSNISSPGGAMPSNVKNRLSVFETTPESERPPSNAFQSPVIMRAHPVNGNRENRLSFIKDPQEIPNFKNNSNQYLEQQTNSNSNAAGRKPGPVQQTDAARMFSGNGTGNENQAKSTPTSAQQPKPPREHEGVHMVHATTLAMEAMTRNPPPPPPVVTRRVSNPPPAPATTAAPAGGPAEKLDLPWAKKDPEVSARVNATKSIFEGKQNLEQQYPAAVTVTGKLRVAENINSIKVKRNDGEMLPPNVHKFSHHASSPFGQPQPRQQHHQQTVIRPNEIYAQNIQEFSPPHQRLANRAQSFERGASYNYPGPSHNNKHHQHQHGHHQHHHHHHHHHHPKTVPVPAPVPGRPAPAPVPAPAREFGENKNSDASYKPVMVIQDIQNKEFIGTSGQVPNTKLDTSKNSSFANVVPSKPVSVSVPMQKPDPNSSFANVVPSKPVPMQKPDPTSALPTPKPKPTPTQSLNSSESVKAEKQASTSSGKSDPAVSVGNGNAGGQRNPLISAETSPKLPRKSSSGPVPAPAPALGPAPGSGAKNETSNEGMILTPVVSRVMGGAQQQRATITQREVNSLQNNNNNNEKSDRITNARSNISSLLTNCQPATVQAPVSQSVTVLKPAPVSVSQPAPVSVSQPAPVSVAQPAPVSVSKPAPVSQPTPVSQPPPVALPTAASAPKTLAFEPQKGRRDSNTVTTQSQIRQDNTKPVPVPVVPAKVEPSPVLIEKKSPPAVAIQLPSPPKTRNTELQNIQQPPIISNTNTNNKSHYGEAIILQNNVTPKPTTTSQSKPLVTTINDSYADNNNRESNSNNPAIPRQRSLSEFPRPRTDFEEVNQRYFQPQQPNFQQMLNHDYNLSTSTPTVAAAGMGIGMGIGRRVQDIQNSMSPASSQDSLQRTASGSSIFDRAQTLYITVQDSPNPPTARKKPPSLPKAGLVFPKQFEAQMSPESAGQKKRELEAYFGGKSSSSFSASSSSGNKNKSSHLRKSASQGRLVHRQRSLSDGEEDVDQIFESLFKSNQPSVESISSKIAEVHVAEAAVSSSTISSASSASTNISEKSFESTESSSDSSKTIQSQAQQRVSTSESKSVASSKQLSSSSLKLTSSSSSTSKSSTSSLNKFKQLDQQAKAESGNKTEAPLFKFTNEALKTSATSAKDILLYWCQCRTRDYQNVKIENFSSSWSDGLGFCALIHHFYPDAFEYSALDPKQRRQNFELAFKVAEEKADIYPLLDAEDMVAMGRRPDWKCVFTYVQSMYRKLKDLS